MSEPIQVAPARSELGHLDRQVSVLLGRAYTDKRHLDRWSEAEHAELDGHVARVHGAAPGQGELMPETYLAHFPTWRNFRRPVDSRREAYHFVVPGDGYLRAHVSLWPHRFLFEGMLLNGGYIEDVATDPLHLGEGLATQLMEGAVGFARDLRLDLLGLATGIVPFYERLNWKTWNGSHRFSVLHLEYPDEPLMLLPLTDEGRRFASNTGEMRSRRLWRFGEIPDDWP